MCLEDDHKSMETLHTTVIGELREWRTRLGPWAHFKDHSSRGSA